MERIIYIFRIALEAVFINRFRSILTALGIIFGVAAVIAMLAVGNGAKQETLEQIKLVGVNNIVIIPKNNDMKGSSEIEDEDGPQMSEKYSPGLSLADANSIKDIIPVVQRVSPEVKYETFILKDGIQKKAQVNGITEDYFQVYNLRVVQGKIFSKHQMQKGEAVCIIGENIQVKFFPRECAVGKSIKCGNVWLKIIGVLENRAVSSAAMNNYNVGNFNNTVYAPIQTMLLRYKDRSRITEKSFREEDVYEGGDFVVLIDEEEKQSNNFNQLDKIVVQVEDSKYIRQTESLIRKMLLRRHSEVEDFEILLPEVELKQEQATKERFNIVLGAIASISLIVGGIGIMNIMLASVMERIKEIGVRMAMGARRKDIILQFLTESTLISISGGLIGIVLGIVLSRGISYFFHILTVISCVSILISFVVSAGIGIIFGYMPAKKAASQDPVESLRYE